MKKNAVNATTMSTKEDTTMKKVNDSNSLMINGVNITLTPEQAAAIAAMLVTDNGNSKPSPKRSAKKKNVVSETVALPADITRAKEEGENVDVTTAGGDDAETTKDFTAFKVVLKENVISFTAPNGGFMYQKAPRQALNERLKAKAKEMGYTAKYYKDVLGWKLANDAGKSAPKTKLAAICKAISNPVMPQELDAIYALWDANRAKKAAKATK